MYIRIRCVWSPYCLQSINWLIYVMQTVFSVRVELNCCNKYCAPVYRTEQGRFEIRILYKLEGKAIPWQAWTGPQSSRRLRLPNFKTIGTWRLSAPCTGRLYPQEISLVLISIRGWVNQGHSAAGRIMSIKNSNTIGNRTRDLPSCSAVPQPTVPAHLLPNIYIYI